MLRKTYKNYIQEAKNELQTEDDNSTELNQIRTANDIQIALFKLAKLQREHPIVTPKMKELVNALQAEVIKYELARKKSK